MRTVNKIFVVGNLTRDPQLKKTSNGESICTFGVATNREWQTQGNVKQKSTEFHEIVTWSKLAEICEKLLKKGTLVFIEGYAKTRNWTLDDGNKQYKTEVVATNVITLEKSGKGGDITGDIPMENYEEEAPAIIEEESKEAPPHSDEDAPSDTSEVTIDSELGL